MGDDGNVHRRETPSAPTTRDGSGSKRKPHHQHPQSVSVSFFSNLMQALPVPFSAATGISTVENANHNDGNSAMTSFSKLEFSCNHCALNAAASSPRPPAVKFSRLVVSTWRRSR